MKSILMSIKPKWVEKIASGGKTVEVRKTVPKCGTPFKVYMYCTNEKPLYRVQVFTVYADGVPIEHTRYIKQNGKVVGEFVCDEVIEAVPDYEPYFKKFFNYDFFDKNGEKLEDSLTDDEKADYANEQTLYGLHISDLKIYDKPKELSEFNYACTYPKNTCEECAIKRLKPHCRWGVSLDRPPQSWCYVEEL